MCSVGVLRSRAAVAAFVSVVSHRKAKNCNVWCQSSQSSFIQQKVVGAHAKDERQDQLESFPGRAQPVHSTVTNYSPNEKTIAELSYDMACGLVTSEMLTSAYLHSVECIDRAGPTLRSVLQLNPRALSDARERDSERKSGLVHGPLHGIPILVKDNIETADPMPTTAGSLVLVENQTGRDAPCVARLRKAGAVILGKTNLSEWANFRSKCSSSGWSAVGGLTLNPFALDRTASGSSSGSGVAVTANLASAALGTETDGSVTCPAAVTGIVGMKPTVGLISRRHVVPLSISQDTVGPMARTVEDVALLLDVMAGTDPLDSATWEADLRRVDYTAVLDPDALVGARIGVVRFISSGWDTNIRKVFEQALHTMREKGAELVEITDSECCRQDEIGKHEMTVLLCELKAGLEAYLADAAPGVTAKSLADIIAFNESEATRELLYFGQEYFFEAAASEGLHTKGYAEALEKSRCLAGPEGIDHLLKKYQVDAFVSPTACPPHMIDLVNGDSHGGAASCLPAVAGYPHITVPMGQVFGLPVGLSFIGPAWSEGRLLALAYSFEKLMGPRRLPLYAKQLPTL